MPNSAPSSLFSCAMSANAKTRAVFVVRWVSRKKKDAAFLFGVYPRGLLSEGGSKVTIHSDAKCSFYGKKKISFQDLLKIDVF